MKETRERMFNIFRVRWPKILDGSFGGNFVFTAQVGSKNLFI